MPGYKKIKTDVQEIKMHASKTKQPINYSIKCSSKITWKTWSRLWQEGTWHSLSHGFVRVYTRTRHGCISASVLESLVTLTPALRSRLPTPWPPDGCRGPSRDRKATKVRRRRANHSTATKPLKFQQASWRTPFSSSHPKSQPSTKQPNSNLSPSATALTDA